MWVAVFNVVLTGILSLGIIGLLLWFVHWLDHKADQIHNNEEQDESELSNELV